jgi:biopolymer transport protein ExbB
MEPGTVSMWQEIQSVWIQGGWVMLPLAMAGLFMYYTAAQLWLYFHRSDYRKIAQPVWMSWVDNPGRGEGEVGEIIRYTQDEVRSIGDIQNRFDEVRTAKLPRINRRLTLLYVLVTAAPLMGLLGTVLGMIKTFAAISTGGGSVVEMISSGIAEALITTETGLLIALPGYVMSYVIRSKRNDYQAFLAHLESATMQRYQKLFNGAGATA